jgi:hypothetical protein
MHRRSPGMPPARPLQLLYRRLVPKRGVRKSVDDGFCGGSGVPVATGEFGKTNIWRVYDEYRVTKERGKAHTREQVGRTGVSQAAISDHSSLYALVAPPKRKVYSASMIQLQACRDWRTLTAFTLPFSLPCIDLAMPRDTMDHMSTAPTSCSTRLREVAMRACNRTGRRAGRLKMQSRGTATR